MVCLLHLPETRLTYGARLIVTKWGVTVQRYKASIWPDLPGSHFEAFAVNFAERRFQWVHAVFGFAPWTIRSGLLFRRANWVRTLDARGYVQAWESR